MSPIPFGPLEWDRSRHALTASTAIVNCLPIADGWGPMPSLTVVSQPLPAAPLGAVMVRTSTGGFLIFAGTSSGLYRLDTSSVPFAWIEVGSAYAVPPGERWSFAVYGANLVATNITDGPQYIDVDTGTAFAPVPGSPPAAKHVWVAGDYLVLGYTVDSPYEVRWSAINNFSIWTRGERGADSQTFYDGDEVQGGIGFEDGAIIFQRNAIRQMTRIANEAAFSFRMLNPSRGAISPFAIVNIGAGQFAWLSEQGFFMNAEARPIGAERMDRTFLNAAVNRDRLPEVRGMSDPYNKIVWWQYEQNDGARAMLGYHWQLDRWCWSNQNVAEISSMATPGLTIDGLDNLYATIDDISEPYDSRLFSGGRPTLNGFDAGFALGIFSGAAMEARLATADLQFARGHSTAHEMRVVTDAQDLSLRQRTSAFHGQAPAYGPPVTPFARTGICHFRRSALLAGFEATIPAGAVWSFVTAVAPVRVSEDGQV